MFFEALREGLDLRIADKEVIVPKPSSIKVQKPKLHFGQNGVVFQFLGSVVLNQVRGEEILLAACLREDTGVNSLAQNAQDVVLGLEN